MRMGKLAICLVALKLDINNDCNLIDGRPHVVPNILIPTASKSGRKNHKIDTLLFCILQQYLDTRFDVKLHHPQLWVK